MMLDKIENWALNVFLGKALTRLAIVAVAYVAGPVVQGLAAKAGLTVSIDPVKLQAELIALSLLALEWFKKRRAANPASVTVQTDATAPGADVSAGASAVLKH